MSPQNVEDLEDECERKAAPSSKKWIKKTQRMDVGRFRQRTGQATGDKRNRQCWRKRRFRDIDQVKRYLRRFPNQRYYDCRWCGGYHLTKMDMGPYRKELGGVSDGDGKGVRA